MRIFLYIYFNNRGLNNTSFLTFGAYTKVFRLEESEMKLGSICTMSLLTFYTKISPNFLTSHPYRVLCYPKK